jgi:hypothetical protein
MLTIEEYSVEFLEDPTGILTGDRYEYILNLIVDEDDELYTENGVYLRVILVKENDLSRILQYTFHDRSTNQYIDFGLEEDEEEMILTFCKEHLPVL